MTKRLLLLTFALLLGFSNTYAQKGKLTLGIIGGASSYQGDNNPVASTKDGNFDDFRKNLGVSLGLEGEYGLGEHLGLVARARWGKYKNLEYYFPNSNNSRITGSLLARLYLFKQSRVISPYVNLGYNITTGSKQNPYDRRPGTAQSDGTTGPYLATSPIQNGAGLTKKSLGMGPELGIGMLFNIGPARLGLEVNSFFTAPDVAVDGADPQLSKNGGKKIFIKATGGGDLSDYDAFNYVGAKLLLNLSEGNTCRPALVTGINAASTGNINTAINFGGMVDPNASMPISYMWDFGDGTTATGMNVSHTYSKPGTYTATFSATNCGGTDTKPITPPLSISDPCSTNKPTAAVTGSSSLKTGDSGSYSVSGAGTGVSYTWNFGDGSTGSGARVNHSFSRAGTYNVTSTATNSCGSATSNSFRVTVEAPVVVPPVDPCARVSELNSVYFDFRSTRLDDAAKSLLDENITVLKDCPNLKVDITGYSDVAENSMTLAAQRARAIMDYYVSKGIAASRITASGASIDSAPDKEDPGPGNRRGRRGDSAPRR
jgi:outer membrane protein OmpA-like peptidoglycan-associated protein